MTTTDETARILDRLRLDEERTRDDLLAAYRALDAAVGLVLAQPDQLPDLAPRLTSIRAEVATRRTTYTRAVSDLTAAADLREVGPDDLVNVSDAAVEYGVSRATIHRLIKDGTLPSSPSRPNGGVPSARYVRRADLARLYPQKSD